jgi:hypothetical protein
MTELDQLIRAAYESKGAQETVNKVYLTLLRSTLFVPVIREMFPADNGEPFRPLFAKIDENYFMMVFDTVDRLMNWVGEHASEVECVEMTGKDVINGINENVFLCLNMGTEFYKEFSPDEVKKLKMIVAKIENLK